MAKKTIKKLQKAIKQYGKGKGLKEDKSDFVKWICLSCNSVYNLELEEDEHTTTMWCSKCHGKMNRVKELYIH